LPIFSAKFGHNSSCAIGDLSRRVGRGSVRAMVAKYKKDKSPFT